MERLNSIHCGANGGGRLMKDDEFFGSCEVCKLTKHSKNLFSNGVKWQYICKECKGRMSGGVDGGVSRG